jgi:Xaa-Pro aminopeptidase
MDGARPETLPEALEGVTIRPYDSIYEDLEDIPDGSVIWMDPKTANYEIYTSVMYTAKTHLATTPAALSKMVKNETEIKSAKNAHIKDGAAVTKFIKWLKDEMKKATELNDQNELNELSVAKKLDGLRAEMPDFIELSFPTISAYGANAAMAHYDAKPETALTLKPEGFYLVDSGGQYIDGTTDITRTIAVGQLTDEMRDNYTYVLKSHIAMARLKLREGTSGKEIDEIVRKPMKDVGLDFNHGIGHGVGHVLSVHEDAAVIRSYQEKDSGLKAGMIMSDEPGLYREGEYGIRTENLVFFKKDEEGYIVNEPLTLAPYDRAAINKSLLTEDEIKWVDDYHRCVREKLAPYLSEDERAFLEDETAPL